MVIDHDEPWQVNKHPVWSLPMMNHDKSTSTRHDPPRRARSSPSGWASLRDALLVASPAPATGSVAPVVGPGLGRGMGGYGLGFLWISRDSCGFLGILVGHLLIGWVPKWTILNHHVCDLLLLLMMLSSSVQWPVVVIGQYLLHPVTTLGDSKPIYGSCNALRVTCSSLLILPDIWPADWLVVDGFLLKQAAFCFTNKTASSSLLVCPLTLPSQKHHPSWGHWVQQAFLQSFVRFSFSKWTNLYALILHHVDDMADSFPKSYPQPTAGAALEQCWPSVMIAVVLSPG